MLWQRHEHIWSKSHSVHTASVPGDIPQCCLRDRSAVELVRGLGDCLQSQTSLRSQRHLAGCHFVQPVALDPDSTRVPCFVPAKLRSLSTAGRRRWQTLRHFTHQLVTGHLWPVHQHQMAAVPQETRDHRPCNRHTSLILNRHFPASNSSLVGL